MLESGIQNKIIKHLRSRGAIVNKTISMSKSGWPDIVGCYKGRFIGIEVKRPGKVPTPLQEFKLAELETAGAYVGAATSVAEARALLDSLDKALSSS